MSENINGKNNEINKILNQYKEMHKASGADIDKISDNEFKSIFEKDLADGKIDGKYEENGNFSNLLNGFDSKKISQEMLESFNKEVAEFIQTSQNENAGNSKIDSIEFMDFDGLRKLGYEAEDVLLNPLSPERKELTELEMKYGYYGDKADEATKARMNELNSKLAQQKTPIDQVKDELAELQMKYGYYGDKADEATKAHMNDLNNKIYQMLEEEDAKRAKYNNSNIITQDDDLSVIKAKMEAQLKAKNK